MKWINRLAEKVCKHYAVHYQCVTETFSYYNHEIKWETIKGRLVVVVIDHIHTFLMDFFDDTLYYDIRDKELVNALISAFKTQYGEDFLNVVNLTDKNISTIDAIYKIIKNDIRI
jgi:hypothetical protein